MSRIPLDQFPKTERTFLSHCERGLFPLRFTNDGGHPCEYIGYDKHSGMAVMMVKYYRGRLLSTYKITQPQTHTTYEANNGED